MASETAMTKPLWHGTGCYVPKEIAVCPECGGELQARSMEWATESGRPNSSALEVYCVNDYSDEPGDWHSYRQDKWQPINDAIAKWCGAIQL